VEQSLALIEQILGRLPAGAVSVPVKPTAGEGLGFAEAFRGDVLVWLRLGERGLQQALEQQLAHRELP